MKNVPEIEDVEYLIDLDGRIDKPDPMFTADLHALTSVLNHMKIIGPAAFKALTDGVVRHVEGRSDGKKALGKANRGGSAVSDPDPMSDCGPG